MKTVDTGIMFAGLKLKNPIIIESSELTDSAFKIKILEDCGASAVVLKSIYEEQIMMSLSDEQEENKNELFFNEDIRQFVTDNHLYAYLSLIKECKETCSIPIIASINCHTNRDWVKVVKDMEKAGADAIEINFAIHDQNDNNDIKICEIISSVKDYTSLPVILKIMMEYENCIKVLSSYNNEPNGLIVSKNHFSNSIRKQIIESNFIFSDISIKNKPINNEENSDSSLDLIDIAISQNINTADDVINCILSGAKAIAVNSIVYNLGPDYIPHILAFLTNWMYENNYMTIEDFRGKTNRESHNYIFNFN